MGKMKRFFSLMLVLTIVLGSFGSVFAAEEVKAADEELKKVPTDVIGTEYEKAVARLVAFGVLDGYKDGTYRPDQDVTRAEFAKILVEALGIGKAAEAAKGKVTFKDVPASHWASGYVNVASGEGLLVGFPDGTFKPEQQVSYADALTMLVRALGYQDSFLKGAWPGSHIAKAAEVGITSGVNFADARGFSNRGNVAQMVNNTLDCDVVKVETYKDGTVEYKETEKTLLKDRLDISKYEDTRVVADKIVDDGLDTDEITVRFLKDIDKDDESVKKSYKEGDEKDFRIRKGVNTRRYIGEESSVYMDNKDVVVYIETENDDKAYFDYVEAVKGDDKETEEISLVRFDKDYKFDKDATVYVYDQKDDQYKNITVDKDGVAVEASTLLGRVGKFVVKNNRVIYAEIMESAEALPWMLVKENKKGLLEGINQTTEDFDLDLSKDGNYDGVLVFDTLGNPLDVEEIKEGNILYVAKLDYDGDDYAHVVVVQDNMVEGKLSKVKDDRVTLDDKQIKAVRYKDNGNQFQAYYSVEGFEDIKEWNDPDFDNDMEDADDENMVAYLDATGKIAFLSTDAIGGGAGYKYGVVTRAYADNDRIKIYTQVKDNDGEEITYKVEEEDNLENPMLLDKYGNKDKVSTDKYDKDKLTGSVVKFKLNKDGEIAKDEFYVMKSENYWVMQPNKDFGKDTIPSKLGSETKAFSVDNRVVIIDAEGLDPETGKIKDVDDFGIAKWENMAEDNNNDKLKYFVFTKRNNDIDVDAIVFVGDEGANTGSDEEAVYVIDKWRSGGDDYVKFMSYETGKVEEREVDKGYDKKERPYIAKIKSGGKIELFTKDKGDLSYVEGVVNTKKNNVITLTKDKNKEYKLASSAIVYEEDVKKQTSNIREGDAVFFIVENGVNIRVIERLIDDEAEKVKEGKDDNDEVTLEGIVTYANNTPGNESFAVDNSKSYYLDKKSEFIVDGKITAMGADKVIAEIMKYGDSENEGKGAQVDVTVKDGVITIKLVKAAGEISLDKSLSEAKKAAKEAKEAYIAAGGKADDELYTKLEDALKDAKANSEDIEAIEKATEALVERTKELNKDKNVEKEVNKFKEDHKDVLALTVETVAVKDEAKVKYVLAAFDLLSDGAQEKLSDEKTKLDNLIKKIAELEEEEAKKADQKAVDAAEAKVKENKTIPSITVVDGDNAEALDKEAAVKAYIQNLVNGVTVEVKTEGTDYKVTLTKGDATPATVIVTVTEFIAE